MPQLIFKGLKQQEVKSISKELVASLSEISETPADYFTLECVTNTFIFDGNIVDMYPLIEVKWFDRGKNCQDQCAQSITNFIQALGYTSVEVYFTVLSERKYYENGVSFDK